jgi:chromosome segregation ATPase
MSVEALIDDALPMPPDPGESAEIVGFLRRFSNLISYGENAENLRRAAALIEVLTSRAGEAEHRLYEQTDTGSKYREMCQAFEIAVDRLASEAVELHTQLDQTTEQALAERYRLTEDNARLSADLERTEAALAAANAEVDELRGRLADTTTVPIENLRAIQTQFEFLSDHFARSGDVIAQVMSDIGWCATDQAISGVMPKVENLA